MRRVGPPLLLSLLHWTGAQIEQFWNEQDMDALGEPVSWAGPGSAPVWMDAALVVRVEGPGGGSWALRWIERAWTWADAIPDAPAPRLVLDVDTAWQVWTRGIEPEQTRDVVVATGDEELTDAALAMVSIIC